MSGRLPNLGRREVLVGAAALALPLPALAAKQQYLVGCIKPLSGPKGGKPDLTVVNLKKVLPPNVQTVETYLGIKEGTDAEMLQAMDHYHAGAVDMAARKCNLIALEGAPPFMILGRAKETALVSKWHQEFKLPMFTSSQNQVNAFKAVRARNILGITELEGPMNDTFATYFRAAGYNVVAMDAMPGHNFSNLWDVTSQQVYDFIKQRFQVHKGKKIDTIYMLGPTWGTNSALDIIEPLERELGITMVHPIPAESWEIQKRLKIHHPVKGYGKLLATMPA